MRIAVKTNHTRFATEARVEFFSSYQMLISPSSPHPPYRQRQQKVHPLTMKPTRSTSADLLVHEEVAAISAARRTSSSVADGHDELICTVLRTNLETQALRPSGLLCDNFSGDKQYLGCV